MLHRRGQRKRTHTYHCGKCKAGKQIAMDEKTEVLNNIFASVFNGKPPLSAPFKWVDSRVGTGVEKCFPL